VHNGTDGELDMGARCRMNDTTKATELVDQEARWTAWVARNVERDRQAQKYRVAFAVAVAIVLAASLVISLVAR